jgi:phosphotransferase system HPr (HPr) family protein
MGQTTMLPASQPHDSARILVVDDDRDTAETLAYLLRIFGHDVRTALDGYQAIEIARRERPTHVLLDLGLPGLDGYQVASRLREELPETIGLIAITGYGCEEDRRRALAAGFDHHFLKPLDGGALNTLLATLADGSWGGQTAPVTEPSPMAEEAAAISDPSRWEPRGRPVGRESPVHAVPSHGAMSPERAPILPVSQQVEITNAQGLHLRAADKFVRLARQFRADVWVARDGRKASGRSILDLTTLAAARGTRLELEADGPDAEAALDALTDLIGRGFDEQDG